MDKNLFYKLNLMKKLLCVVAFFLFFSEVFAQQIPVLEVFHGRECPHCQKEMKWLPTLQKMYPSLKIKEYEVWHDEANKALVSKRMKEMGKEFTGVPTNIIEGEVIVGFQPERIVEVLKAKYGAPKEVIESSEEETSLPNWIWGLVLFLLTGTVFVYYKKQNA